MRGVEGISPNDLCGIHKHKLKRFMRLDFEGGGGDEILS